MDGGQTGQDGFIDIMTHDKMMDSALLLCGNEGDVASVFMRCVLKAK